MEQDCSMWGLRVIIPPVFQQRVLTELHQTHPGIARMEAVWLVVRLDDAIEDTVHSCQQCIKTRIAPPRAPLHSWIWQRIHIDLATYEGNNYLIVVDAHSKWSEVIGPIQTTNAKATINALRAIFARYSLRQQIVSSNGPQFQSEEYDYFLTQNGI